MSKLLIVDDDEQSLYMLQTLLQGHGYDVESATNGAEALEKAQHNPPDMIISDILMPVMDGFTLCRKLKQDEQLKHIPFIFYTATYTDPRDEELALKLGANRYLLKPIEPETFIKILHDVVQNAEKSKVMTKKPALEDEKEIYTLYNERLIKKLEKKMRDLEQEVTERKQAQEALKKYSEQLEEMVEDRTTELTRANASLKAEIVERKRVERGLRQERDKAQQYFDLAAVIMVIIGVDQKVKLINKKGCKILGYKEEKIINKNWFDNFLPECVREALRTGFITLMKQPEKDIQEVFEEGGENPVLTKDGEERIIEWYNALVKDEHGNIIGTLSSGKDITECKRAEEELRKYRDYLEESVEKRTAELKRAVTDAKRLNEQLQQEIMERKRTEEALRESEERYRKIFDTFPDSLFIADFKGNIVEANPAACQQYQYAREEFIKMHASQLITPEYLPKLEEFVRSLKASGTFIGETVDVRKDGTTFDTEVHGAVIHFKGKPHMMALIRDITEHKQAEEKLQRYAAELQAANAELSQYAYAVSHDLKAPLRAIRNYTDFLREDLETTLDDEQKAYLDGLESAVQEAHASIKDLLELSRIDRRSVDIETIEVGGFFRTLIASLDLPDEVEIVMRDDWPTLEVEPALLRQVFQNLIDNAVKFNPSSPKRIELGWQPVGEDCCEFFVSDNGIGINPRYQEKIFRVFERLHTKEEFEGTGIGLAIVKKAVGKLGGSVRVESTPGSGSTFFVALPKVTIR